VFAVIGTADFTALWKTTSNQNRASTAINKSIVLTLLLNGFTSMGQRFVIHR
jgi:hypothetical protein